MKGPAELVSKAMISRWGMGAIGSTCRLNDIPYYIQLSYPVISYDALEMYTADTEHILIAWGVLIGFSLLFILMGDMFLHRISKDSRRV